MKPVTAGVILTRRCNLHCKYCAIPDRISEDMQTSDWLTAIDILGSLGIKKINFIGGETTLYKGIREVISHTLSSQINYCSLITNGIKGFDVIRDLINIGLQNVSFSLDTLNIEKSISPIKARAGINLIEALECNNLLKKIKLTAYCVINRTNLETIPELVKYLTDKGITIYFLPYHWNKEEGFEHRKQDYGLSLKKDEKLRSLLDNLISMKKQGFLIANSLDFFSMIYWHIEKLDWHCSYLSELRVDADGKLMCCCDKRGNVNNKFTIFDLKDENKFQQFLEDRKKDAKICNGCLWPSSFEAELLNKESNNAK